MLITDIVKILTDAGIEQNEANIEVKMLIEHFAGYGIGRAWIESIRTDQLYITGTTIPVSLVLGLAMAAAAITADLVIRYRLRKQGDKTGGAT